MVTPHGAVYGLQLTWPRPGFSVYGAQEQQQQSQSQEQHQKGEAALHAYLKQNKGRWGGGFLMGGSRRDPNSRCGMVEAGLEKGKSWWGAE